MGVDIDQIPDALKHSRTKTLARESSSLAFLAHKLGKRMRYWLKQTELEKLSGAGPLPDSEWRETYDLYQKTVLGLLKEQRERQKLADAVVRKGGAAVLTSGEYETELLSLARETIRLMPEDELQALLAERGRP